MVGPFFEIGPDASPFFQADGKVKFNFNEINANYGQNVNFGDRLTTNLFVGVSFVEVCQDLNYTYAGTKSGKNVSRNISTPTKFRGAGPQFGIDFSYDIFKGLGFGARLAGSILNGQSSNHTTYTSLSGLTTQSPNIQTTKTNNISLVVPSLFQRIGLVYVYEFCDHYSIKAEAGYQAQLYFNVLQTVDMGSEVVTPPVQSSAIGVYARTFQRNISNFSLTGAYLSASFCF